MPFQRYHTSNKELSNIRKNTNIQSLLNQASRPMMIQLSFLHCSQQSTNSSLHLQLLQKMSNLTEALSIQQFPHFKTQWHSFGSHFRNNFSSDLCQLKILRCVPMKELDLYSHREAYSFPFCPRVYKYNIDKNEVIDNKITFDIKLLLEHVPHRMSNTEINEQLVSKIIDIVRTIEYLRGRFGLFRIRKGMIGWTDLGVVKVWISEDFADNAVEEEANSEEEMVGDFFMVFEDVWIVDCLKEKGFGTFREIIQYIEENMESKTILKDFKKALQQIQNYPIPRVSCDRSIRNDIFPQGSISNSKKNITFSYSNKEVNNPPQRAYHNNTKRSSIAVLENSFRGSAQTKPLSPNKSFKFGWGQQVSSLKMIQQKKANQLKKMSVFRPTQSFQSNRETTGQFKPKKLSEYFSAHSNSFKDQAAKINELSHHLQSRPDMLFYSTSSNPYSKFMNQVPTNKSLSSRQQNESINSEESQNKENRDTMDALNQHLSEFSVTERKQGKVSVLKSSQELRNDLDALFNSDHQFDYGQLQNELDHIL